MTEFVARIRKIPAIGRNIPKEIAPTLSAIKQAVDQLSGSGALGALRRADFENALRPYLPPGGGNNGGGGNDGSFGGDDISGYIADLQKLVAQAQHDVLGIYRQIEVDRTLATDLAGLAHENLGVIEDHATELEEHANELADHALDLIDLATTLEIIEEEFNDPVTGLLAVSTLLDATVVRVDETESGLDVLTAQVSALESEIIDTSALDPAIMWQFESDDDDWTSNATLTTNDFYVRIAAGASTYFRSPAGLVTAGGLFPRVVARIRRVSGTGWLGRVSYATSGGGSHGIDTTNYHNTLAVEPSLAGGGWTIVVWDMELLTAGGTDWVDSIIDQLQLELSDDGSTVFEVDWVAIGRVAPSYVAAVVNALEARVTQTETDITALSSSVTSLQSDLTDLEGDVDVSAGAISTLDTRIDAAEDDISANSTAITSLDLRLDDAEADITASASAITGLDTRLDSAEGTISSHSSQLTSLDARVDDTEADISTNASAITSLDARVDVTESSITTHASRLTALEVSVDDPVNGIDALATLVDTFDTRIVAAEDSVDALSFTVTALESEVNDLDSEVGGYSSAISSLNTRVTTAEGNVLTQANAVQLLNVRGGGTDANRVNPLDTAGYVTGWSTFAPADVANINIGGRNAVAARIRTNANVEVQAGYFFCEPNEILEVRFSILKTVAHGSMYLGMNALDLNGVEAAVSSVYNRAIYEGPHTNPYWWYTQSVYVGNSVPINTWYDVTVYILGNAVPPDQCPAGLMNNVRNRFSNISVNFPWLTRFVDGFKLPADSRRARVRVLNYYNNVLTDMYVRSVSVKRIDNQNTAAVETEESARVSGDQSLAQSISTVSTTVGSHTASINSLVSSVNGIAAQWVLQLDVNGRITGIRLAGSSTFTSFTILADQFSVVMPGVGAVTPFTVGLVDGVPTVGITGNLVVDGTIATRHLLVESVTSVKIANRAVTRVGQGANFSLGIATGINIFATTFIDIFDGWVGPPVPGPPAIPMLVQWSCAIQHSVNQDPANQFQVWLERLLPGSGSWSLVDGPFLANSRNFLGEVYPGFLRMMMDAPTTRGTYGFRVVVQLFSGSGYLLNSAKIQVRADLK